MIILTPYQDGTKTVDLPRYPITVENINVDNVHMKSLICDINSLCFALRTSSSALTDALKLHSIMYSGLHVGACQAALIHHLLYGHSHRHSLPASQVIAKSSTSMGALAVSLSEEVLNLFHCSELSLKVFEDLCLFMGF